MEEGRWKMEDGRWKMEEGRGEMEEGRGKREEGRRKRGDGRRETRRETRDESRKSSKDKAGREKWEKGSCIAKEVAVERRTKSKSFVRSFVARSFVSCGVVVVVVYIDAYKLSK